MQEPSQLMKFGITANENEWRNYLPAIMVYVPCDDNRWWNRVLKRDRFFKFSILNPGDGCYQIVYPIGECPVDLYKVVITRGLQIGPMRKRALHFLNIVVYILRCLFKLTHLFFFRCLPPLPSWSNDFYCITSEWTAFYAYDTTLPCSLFHNPLFLHHRFPYTLFFLLQQGFDLSLTHLSYLWALSISYWKFTYLRFVK